MTSEQRLKLKIHRISGGDNRGFSMEGEESAHNQTKENWIGKTFKKRECSRYLPANDEKRCGCGRSRAVHVSGRSAPTSPAESPLHSAFTTYRGEKWQANLHTALLPTDAYGKIDFYGVAQSSRAQYVRLEHDTAPEDILHLLLNVWRLEPPRLIISVHGSRSRFGLQPKIKFAFSKGLVEAARTTSAWIITDGANRGVADHVGKAIDGLQPGSQRCKKRLVTIGIAPWGATHKAENLIGMDAHVSYNSSASVRDAWVLNGSHNYFLLADDGSYKRPGAEAVLRKRLEQTISQRKLSKGAYRAASAVPIVCVVLEGDGYTLKTVAEYVTSPLPTRVVVLDGSGPAADLIAFSHKYSSDEGVITDDLRRQLLTTTQRTFAVGEEKARRILADLDLCLTKKSMITVFRVGDEAEEFDVAILASLLRSHGLRAAQQLAITLMWNRCDIARHHVFSHDQEWPDGSLELAMMDALAQNKVDFVQLLLEKGLNMRTFLTVKRLEDLYNMVADTSPTMNMALRGIRSAPPSGSRITLIDVGLVLNRLMGGDYRSNYRRREFKQAYREIMQNIAATVNPLASTPSCELNSPYSDLLIWAVLSRRHEMALFMWRHEQEALAKALVAARIYAALSELSHRDPAASCYAAELLRYSTEFRTMAENVLDYSFKRDEALARQLLVYELKNWGGQTCLGLAYGGGVQGFLAHACCQKLISDIWMGGLSSNAMVNVKVLAGLLFPPVILTLNYKTPAKLNEMPQTVEEHEQEQKRARADSAVSKLSEAEQVAVNSTAELTAVGGVGVVMDDDPGITNGESDEPVTWSIASPPIARREDSADAFFPPDAAQPKSPPEEAKQDRPSDGALEASYRNSVDSERRTSQLLGITMLRAELPLWRKYYEFYTAPITKFWFHLLAYMAFLCVMTYTVLVDMHWEPHVTEVYTSVCVLLHSVEVIEQIIRAEPKTFRRKVTAVFSNRWILSDAVAVVVYWLGTILRFLPQDEVQLWGHIVYSLDTIIWYTLVMRYFQVSSHLGPFIVIVSHLLEHLAKFVIFFLVFVVAYGVPRQAILNPEHPPNWDVFVDVVMEPYFMIYGELFSDKLNPPCGPDSEYACYPGRWIVPILTSVYLLVSYVLLMNLIIAVFNTTFVKLNADSKHIWMYQRYGLTLEYDRKTVFPPPFAIFTYSVMAYRFLRRLRSGKPAIQDNGIKLFLSKVEVQRLLDFEEDCVNAFFEERNNVLASSVDIARASYERTESLGVKIDDIYQRENQLYSGIVHLVHKFQAFEAKALAENAARRRGDDHKQIETETTRSRSLRPDEAPEPERDDSPNRSNSDGRDLGRGCALPSSLSQGSVCGLAAVAVAADKRREQVPSEEVAAALSAVGQRLTPQPTGVPRWVSPAISLTASNDEDDNYAALTEADRSRSGDVAVEPAELLRSGDSRRLSTRSISSVTLPSSYVESSFIFAQEHSSPAAPFPLHSPVFMRRCRQMDYTSTTDGIEPSFSISATPLQSSSPDNGYLELVAGQDSESGLNRIPPTAPAGLSGNGAALRSETIKLDSSDEVQC